MSLPDRAAFVLFSFYRDPASLALHSKSAPVAELCCVAFFGRAVGLRLS